MEEEYRTACPSFGLMAKSDPRGKHKNLCANLCAKLQRMFRSEILLRNLVGAWGFEPQTPTVSAPIAFEALSVPFDNCLWLNDDENGAPVAPQL